MNHLANEKSPYLLQHAENPVDWYAWGDEAFQKAVTEDKPIFLSIGYATCHWCHVMAHESFEDEDIAALLNKYFVSIKVDREERPDIDHIYMSVCQAMTGRGGWPLTIFLTPEARPFFAGTYFPKHGRMGLSGFIDILEHIRRLWKEDRESVLEAGNKVTDHIRLKKPSQETSTNLGEDTLRKSYELLKTGFDSKYGGFGHAPKFPTPHQLTFLLRWYKRSGDADALDMVTKTLKAMRNGGIYDQIGFGFHRYSVDEKWLVPHFEKMLYDQALLAMAYIEAFQATEDPDFAKAAKEIFEYVLRDMTHPEGGFYSAEDADSEGREGLFYVWTPKEIKDLLGKDLGDLVCRYYGLTDKGNFEDGYSIAHISVPVGSFAEANGMSKSELEKTFEAARQKLFNVRKQRIHPLKDDKVLTSWNGLMIAAFSKGFQVFGDETYGDAAKASAQFILTKLRRPDGRLLRRFREGDADYTGYLDDYAFLVWGLLDLYEATFEVQWLEQAIDLNKAMIDIYWDHEGGGLFFTGKGNETLIVRTKEAYDGALPSGNSIAALNFLRLGRMTGNVDLEKKAEQVMNTFAAQISQYPVGYTQLLASIDFLVGPAKEIVIVDQEMNDTTAGMLRTINGKFIPNKVMLLRHEGEGDSKLESLTPFIKSMTAVNQKTTVYLCEQYACQTPFTELTDVETALK